ncbi:MAG: hypothetical protein QM831_34905 [Kofleriaceae bacterium]
MRRLLILLLCAACHHDAAPAAPADPTDKPPLPPASGTPIGFIIDDAGELKLTDAQLAKLHDIDTSLAAELEKVDAASRSQSRPADGDGSTPPAGGGRHHRGGGMGGGMGGGGGGGGRHHRGQGSGSGSGSGSSGNAAMIGKLDDQRKADVKDALTQAFALLDAGQQTIAKKVLADHDVDLDVATITPAGPPTLPPPGNDEADPPPEP